MNIKLKVLFKDLKLLTLRCVTCLAVFMLSISAANALTGGPDTFGYTFADSDEGSCSVTFNDIGGSGTDASITGDDVSGDVTIPFTFNLYGTTGTQLRVSSNGGARLVATTATLPFTNADLPSAGQTLGLFPLWDDWRTDAAGASIRTETQGVAPNRRFIVQWDDIQHFGADVADRSSFQVVLHETTNNIDFAYTSLTIPSLPAAQNGSSATIGINQDGSDSLKYSFDTVDALSTVTAICITAPAELVDDFRVTSYNATIDVDVGANDPTLDVGSVCLEGVGTPGVCDGDDSVEFVGEGLYEVIAGDQIRFTPDPSFNGEPTPINYLATVGGGSLLSAELRILINERSLCLSDGTPGTEPYVMGNPEGTNNLVVFQVGAALDTSTGPSSIQVDHNALRLTQAPTVGTVNLINSFGLDTARDLAFYQDSTQETGGTGGRQRLYMYDANSDEIVEIIGPNAAGGFADFSDIGVTACGSELGGAAGEYFGGSYYFGIEEDQGCTAAEQADGRDFDQLYRVVMDFSFDPPRPAGDAILIWEFDPANTGGIGAGTSHDWGDVLVNHEVIGGEDRIILIDLDRNTGTGGEFITRIDITDPNNPVFLEINQTATVGEISQSAIAFDGTVYYFLDGGDEIAQFDVTLLDADGIGVQEGTVIKDIAGPGWPDGANTVDGSSCVDPTGAFAPDFDMGDAPESYETLRSEDGPRHLIESGADDLRFGAAIDFESTPAAVLPGANNNGTNGDGVDEDGILIVAENIATLPEITATLAVVNDTGDDAFVCAWLDRWDGTGFGDGDFDLVTDASDSHGACQTVTDNAGVSVDYTFTWDTGLASVAGQTYTRFRICSTLDECDQPTGDASNGEVEDYLLAYTPTSVRIDAVKVITTDVNTIISDLGVANMSDNNLFALLQQWIPGIELGSRQSMEQALVNYLDPNGDQSVIQFEWSTSEERGTVGFYAQRKAADGSWKNVNDQMLPGLITAPMGGEYLLFDPEAEREAEYEYRLIEQEATGLKNTYGPFKIKVDQ